MRKRRRNVGFSLAFLDVMSCGFGAVVLIFLIINQIKNKLIKKKRRFLDQKKIKVMISSLLNSNLN